MTSGISSILMLLLLNPWFTFAWHVSETWLNFYVQQTVINLSDQEKSDCIKAHLNCAQAEREFYRSTCLDMAMTFKCIEALIILMAVNESNKSTSWATLCNLNQSTCIWCHLWGSTLSSKLFILIIYLLPTFLLISKSCMGVLWIVVLSLPVGRNTKIQKRSVKWNTCKLNIIITRNFREIKTEHLKFICFLAWKHGPYYLRK